MGDKGFWNNPFAPEKIPYFRQNHISLRAIRAPATLSGRPKCRRYSSSGRSEAPSLWSRHCSSGRPQDIPSVRKPTRTKNPSRELRVWKYGYGARGCAHYYASGARGTFRASETSLKLQIELFSTQLLFECDLFLTKLALTHFHHIFKHVQGDFSIFCHFSEIRCTTLAQKCFKKYSYNLFLL